MVLQLISFFEQVLQLTFFAELVQMFFFHLKKETNPNDEYIYTCVFYVY